MPHVMFGGLAHEQALPLARRLAALLPGDLDHVFFSESGSVAVEIAMKMALQYWINRGERGARQVRRVPGRLSRRHHRRDGGVRSRGGHARAVRAACCRSSIIADLPRTTTSGGRARRAAGAPRATSIAGIIVEPLVQGAGGMRFHDAAMLRRLRAVGGPLRAALLIFDEIFTGFGRTGTMFACEAGRCRARHHHAVEGADRRHAAARRHRRAHERCSTRSGRTIRSKALMHGPTYMGNALACAAANASLDLFEREPRLDAGQRDVAADRRASWRPAAACRASRTCGSRARSAWSRWSGSTISTRCARGLWRRACSSARSALSSI